LHSEAGAQAVAVYDEAFAHGNDHLWWHDEIAKYPVYRWAMQNTLGVVTHAEFYQELVEERVGCPTRTIPLAYDAPLGVPRPTTSELDNKLTILTVGSVNTNKRYHAVIRAIAESPLLRERCRYRIVGPYDEARRKMIQSVVDSQPIKLDVTMTGLVDRATLSRELAAADIISCLRYPALEGASASVIEGLLTAKPVVVCDTGCYREIPDQMVYKVDPDREHRQLMAALEQIVRNYELARNRAVRAAEWAAERHSPDQYAQQLLEFAPQVLYNRPALAIIDRIANHLRQWNVPADDLFMSRVDRAMDDLFSLDQQTNEAVGKRAA
jgi:glycosyltransferase involved in cell wall biosynthesis